MKGDLLAILWKVEKEKLVLVVSITGLHASVGRGAVVIVVI